MLANVEDQTKRLRYAANMLLAATWEAKSGGELESALNGMLAEVEYKFKDLPTEQLEGEANSRLRKAGIVSRFHWPMEFPEVFIDKGGFDAFIGNPPFAGKNGILATHGSQYLKYVQTVFEGSHGYSDFCTYFFRRSFQLVILRGLCGLVGTNSVAQGKARESGLGWINQNQGVIISALTDVAWPGKAVVLICVPIIYKGSWLGFSTLNGELVSAISSTLEPIAEKTVHILNCHSGRSTTGFLTYGRGFVVTSAG